MNKFTIKIMYIIASFYSFIKIQDPKQIIDKIKWKCKKEDVNGTILLAKEGFNGSLCASHKGTVQDILSFVIKLCHDNLAVDDTYSEDEFNRLSKLSCLSLKYNHADKKPLYKLKIKEKPEIVSLGVGDIDVAALKGEYIKPSDWDEFIARKDVVLIDTRNDYEIEMGSFKSAVNPKTETFKQFPDWAAQNADMLKGKKIAMCCTGGIRCEKSTAFMKQLGYNDVYHLEGGILQYLEEVKHNDMTWEGDCFVFDDRVAVDKSLKPSEGKWFERADS